MFTINPTPYVFAYAFLVFFCPWCVYATHLVRELRFLMKNDIVQWFNFSFISMWRSMKQFRKDNPEAKHLYGKVKKWLVITLASWIVGFALLGITLYVLDRNVPRPLPPNPSPLRFGGAERNGGLRPSKGGDFAPQTPLRFASPLLDAPRGAQS